MGLYAVLIACSALSALMTILFCEIRIKRLELMLADQRRLLETLTGMTAVAAAPRPPTQRLERRADTRGVQREPSPRGVPRLEPSPRGVPRQEPSPRGVPRMEPSPLRVPRLEGRTPVRTAALPDPATPAPDPHGGRPGGSWTPSHRISVISDQGRSEAWVVMMLAGPDGGRIAPTKQEWHAGITPAWRCDAAGAWTRHGRPIEHGHERVVIEDLRA